MATFFKEENVMKALKNGEVIETDLSTSDYQLFMDVNNRFIYGPSYAKNYAEETYEDWHDRMCEMLEQIASDHFDDFHCTPFGFEWKELAHLNADPKVLGLLHLDNEGMGLSKDYHELQGITYEETHTMQYGVYKTTVWVVRSL